VPLPLLQTIAFKPALPEKAAAAGRIGFGGVIKTLLRFDERWWGSVVDRERDKMVFIVSNEALTTWWEQYPERLPLLVGWVAGPRADKIKGFSNDEIIRLALVSLSHIFGVSEDDLRRRLVHATVANWLTDRWARGAYSYPTVETAAAVKELSRPVGQRLFFAGEALYQGQETATVEGALASGREAAEMLLRNV